MQPASSMRRGDLASARRSPAPGTLALALLVALGCQDRPDGTGTVRARRFEIVDADGAVQAVLGADGEGSVGLFVYDADSVVRLSVTHDSSQTALFISDDEGVVRIGVAQFAHGGGGVALHGRASKGATVLYHKGTGRLTFYDEAGSVTERVPAE